MRAPSDAKGQFPTVSYIQPFLDIIGGQRWCIHDFLASLLVEAEADWVGLVDLSRPRLVAKYESGATACRASAAGLLKDRGFEKLLREEPEADRPNWYMYGPEGRILSSALAFGVWHHEGEPDLLKSYRLVLLSPRVLSHSPLMQDFDSTFEIPALALSWFFWASYQREKLQKLCSELHRKEGASEEDRKRLLAAVIWPMPFKSIVEIIEAGRDALKADGGDSWPDRVRRELHIPAREAGCRLCAEGAVPPCVSAERAVRDRFECLSMLIEWRSASAQRGIPSPRIPDASDYKTLRGIGPLFFSAVDPDRLDEKSLTTYFAHNFWREWAVSKNRFRQLQAPGCGPAEQLRHFSCCSHLAHYVLADMPADDQAIEALVWAVSRYGHDHLEIDPQLDLRAHLLHAARNEPALHVLKPFYRDHFFHAVEVCFLGHMLLEMEVESGLPLHALVGKILGAVNKAEVLREWYVAALLHDIGYSVEVLKSARKMLSFCRRSEKISRLGESIDEALRRLSAELSGASPNLPDADQGNVDHGVMGAEHLRAVLVAVSGRTNSTHRYEAALRAIAAHNRHRAVVEFRRDPLAFLLILCDAIQEWNRPHLRFASAPTGILASLMSGAPFGERIDLSGPLETVSLNVTKTAGGFKLKDSSSLEFVVSYGDEINRNAGVFNLWIEVSSNLQRLRLGGLPFNIITRYRTPLFTNDQGYTERQIHRLKSAAEETHMTFLSRWFPSGVDDKAVCYDTDPEGREVLTLSLRELTRERRITEGVEVFRERLALWRNYNEDREFAGDYAPVVP
jgi:hypothetical protein